MKVIVVNHWTEERVVCEGHPALVARQPLVRFPWAGRPGDPVKLLSGRIRVQQVFSARIVDDAETPAGCSRGDK